MHLHNAAIGERGKEHCSARPVRRFSDKRRRDGWCGQAMRGSCIPVCHSAGENTACNRIWRAFKWRAVWVDDCDRPVRLIAEGSIREPRPTESVVQRYAQRQANCRLVRRGRTGIEKAIQERRTVRGIQANASAERAGLATGIAEIRGNRDASTAQIDRQN